MPHPHDHSHVHPHDEPHSHHDHGPREFTSVFIIATIVNLSFVIAEVFYAYFSHSMSLLADAGHNLADVAGLAMSGLAAWLLKKSATQKYSYGFKRTTLLAALFNTLLLIASTVFILIESGQKLFHPVDINEKIVMIVAGIGILINGGTALLFIRGQEDLNVKSAFLHLAYDALLSFGVVLVGVLVFWTHYAWLDPLVGIAIALTIFMGTWGLLRKSIDLNLDAVPHHIDQKAVQLYLTQLPQLVQVHHLHIWALSTQEVALTAHLVFPDNFEDNLLLEKIQTDLLEQFQIHHATLQVERRSNKVCKAC